MAHSGERALGLAAGGDELKESDLKRKVDAGNATKSPQTAPSKNSKKKRKRNKNRRNKTPTRGPVDSGQSTVGVGDTVNSGSGPPTVSASTSKVEVSHVYVSSSSELLDEDSKDVKEVPSSSNKVQLGTQKDSLKEIQLGTQVNSASSNSKVQLGTQTESLKEIQPGTQVNSASSNSKVQLGTQTESLKEITISEVDHADDANKASASEQEQTETRNGTQNKSTLTAGKVVPSPTKSTEQVAPIASNDNLTGVVPIVASRDILVGTRAPHPSFEDLSLHTYMQSNSSLDPDLVANFKMDHPDIAEEVGSVDNVISTASGKIQALLEKTKEGVSGEAISSITLLEVAPETGDETAGSMNNLLMMNSSADFDDVYPHDKNKPKGNVDNVTAQVQSPVTEKPSAPVFMTDTEAVEALGNEENVSGSVSATSTLKNDTEQIATKVDSEDLARKTSSGRLSRLDKAPKALRILSKRVGLTQKPSSGHSGSIEDSQEPSTSNASLRVKVIKPTSSSGGQKEKATPLKAYADVLGDKTTKEGVSKLPVYKYEDEDSEDGNRSKWKQFMDNLLCAGQRSRSSSRGRNQEKKGEQAQLSGNAEENNDSSNSNTTSKLGSLKRAFSLPPFLRRGRYEPKE